MCADRSRIAFLNHLKATFTRRTADPSARRNLSEVPTFPDRTVHRSASRRASGGAGSVPGRSPPHGGTFGYPGQVLVPESRLPGPSGTQVRCSGGFLWSLRRVRLVSEEEGSSGLRGGFLWFLWTLRRSGVQQLIHNGYAHQGQSLESRLP